MRMGVTLAVLALLATGCGSGSAGEAESSASPTAATAPETFDVRGELTLVETFVSDDDDSECVGVDGYDDLQKGVDAVVRDSAGEAVALGRVWGSRSDRASITCNFYFFVSDVPVGERDIYSYEVGSRGELRFTQEEAEAGPLTSTIGP